MADEESEKPTRSTRATATATTGESESVEKTIENAPGITPGNVKAQAVVQSTTEETPSEADKTPAPNVINTENEQPPVRTSKPDTPIAQTLTAGAGEHTPPDPEVYDKEGRPREVSGEPA